MRISALILLSLLTGCSSATDSGIVGTWGGVEASLVLDRSGGTLSYPCGAGTIDPAWTIGPGGHLVASGQHYFGGGPVPPEGHPPHPALYDGRLEGDRLTLTVTLTDLGETLGPFHLVRGGPQVVEQCD